MDLGESPRAIAERDCDKARRASLLETVWLQLWRAGVSPVNIEVHTLVRLETCTVHVGVDALVRPAG